MIELTRAGRTSAGEVEPAEDDPDGAERRGADGHRALQPDRGAHRRRRRHRRSTAGAQPLSYAIAARVELPAEDKQRILELRSEKERLSVIDRLLRAALDRLTEAAAPPAGGSDQREVVVHR